MDSRQPPLWLTFFGRPALVTATGAETPLATRYRKSLALAAWLAAQANRPQRRRAAADLLWPGMNEAAARANLRVVINDLAGRFAALGIPKALEAEREWVALRADERLVTDDMLALDPALAATFAAAHAQRAGMPWCEVDGFDEGEDFGGWLKARRAWFGARHGTPLPAADTPPARGNAPPPAPELPGAGAQWQRLAILRLTLDEEATEDERADEQRRRAQIERLTEELGLYGAVSTGDDAEGASFVFGRHARGGGLRRQALRAALACLELVPQARIGLTAGHLFVEPDGRAFRGRRLSFVARLALCAEPGEIAADESFADLVAGFAAQSGNRRFRARAEETTVFSFAPHDLRDLLRAPTAPETPFVGRLADLERLSRRLSPGAKTAIIGPPGVGKTRLAQEFARTRPGGVFWLFCRAETAREPWAVLLEMLAREDLESLPVREADAARRALASRHVGFTQRGALIAALARLFAGALVVADDAQWMDGATASLLDETARQTSAAWLLTRRPQEGGWLPTDAVRHELSSLDDAAAEELFVALSAPDVSAPQIRNALACSRGLPLFLIAEANGRSSPVADAVAGLCNLPAGRSEALAAAALLGQQFRRDDLAALLGAEAVHDMLAAATTEGIVFAYHRDLWGFVHPLLREECLARLDPADEKPLAARAAERFLARGETARAAELFERAGDAPRAREAWSAVACAALAREDAAAACALFERLAQLGYPEGRTGDWARIHHTKALIVRDGYGIAEIAALCQPIALANRDAADDEARELRFAAEALVYLWSGGESVSSGLAQAARLVALADTPERRFAATWARANTSFFTGDFATARRDFETLLASDLDLSGRTRYFPSDPFAFLATNHAWLRWFVGETGWREEIERHVAATAASPLRQDECIARVFAAAVYLAAGERAPFAAHARTALDIAQMEAFPFWEAYATMQVQIARAQEGIAPEPAACAAIEAAVARAYPAGINTARWLLAEGWIAARRWDDALALLERTFAVAGASEHLYCLPDLYRLQAAALAGKGLADEAGRAMREACRLARETGLSGWLARWENCPPERIVDHRAS